MNKRQRDRWILNLALLIGIGVLLAVLLLDEPDETDTTVLLSEYLPQPITRLKIIREGKSDIEFYQENNHWFMRTPYQQRADSNVLDRLLNIAELEVVSSIKVSEVNTSDFGLQSPQARLLINNTELLFGDIQPVNKLRYLQIDQSIYLIADKHMAQMNTGSISYLDRYLVPQGSHIEKILFDGNNIELTDSLNIQWQSIKANWISPRDTAATDEKGVEIQIVIQGEKEPVIYRAVKHDIDIVLSRDNLEYHLAHSAIKTLGLPFEDQSNIETPTE